MHFRDVTEEIWNCAAFLSFEVGTMSPAPFSDNWFAQRYPELVCGTDSRRDERLPGWYWIATDLSNEELIDIEVELPAEERRCRGTGQYISIAQRAGATLFELDEKVCTTQCCGLRVVYNGHEGWARGRLMGHYKSLDPRTGALRVSQHPTLHLKGRWGAKIFTKDMIEHLNPSVQNLAAHLVASKLGRVVVEMEWRSLYGWPVLCRG